MESSTTRAVPTAGVLLLDSARTVVASAVADAAGRFVLSVPAPGAYYLAAERIGYFDTLSPLLDLSDTADYALDLELRPEPLTLGGLDVMVRNEHLEKWLTLRTHVGNPNALFGFRMIQGERLAAARARSEDTTELLRWLYFPVHHGSSVCVSVRKGCARILVDDRWVPSEHLDSIDFSEVVAVIALPLDTGAELHFITRDFAERFGR